MLAEDLFCNQPFYFGHAQSNQYIDNLSSFRSLKATPRKAPSHISGLTKLVMLSSIIVDLS